MLFVIDRCYWLSTVVICYQSMLFVINRCYLLSIDVTGYQSLLLVINRYYLLSIVVISYQSLLLFVNPCDAPSITVIHYLSLLFIINCCYLSPLTGTYCHQSLSFATRYWVSLITVIYSDLPLLFCYQSLLLVFNHKRRYPVVIYISAISSEFYKQTSNSQAAVALVSETKSAMTLGSGWRKFWHSNYWRFLEPISLLRDSDDWFWRILLSEGRK